MNNSAPAKSPHLPLMAMLGIKAIWRIADASPLYAFGTKSARLAFAQPGNDRLRGFRSASNRPVCTKLVLDPVYRPD